MLSVIMTSWCGDLIGVCHIGVCHIGACQGLPDTFIASLLPCRNRKFSRLIPLFPNLALRSSPDQDGLSSDPTGSTRPGRRKCHPVSPWIFSRHRNGFRVRRLVHNDRTPGNLEAFRCALSRSRAVEKEGDPGHHDGDRSQGCGTRLWDMLSRLRMALPPRLEGLLQALDDQERGHFRGSSAGEWSD
jgi:hypothetical protein